MGKYKKIYVKLELKKGGKTWPKGMLGQAKHLGQAMCPSNAGHSDTQPAKHLSLGLPLHQPSRPRARPAFEHKDASKETGWPQRGILLELT